MRNGVVRRVLYASPIATTLALLGASCAPSSGDLTPEVIGRATHSLDPSAVRELASHHHTGSLKTIRLADGDTLKHFLKNRSAAVRLGKALFWDQQVGSDGQACASCHFHGGADNRTKNQLNPGFNNRISGVNVNAFNDSTGFGSNQNSFGPNYDLKESDFPFHKLADPSDRSSEVISDTNDVVSSQGVFNAGFVATTMPGDIGNAVFGVFQKDGALTRNVEPRSTPTMINAVLNQRNFWDGRAREEFNGVSPIGTLDADVWVLKRPGKNKPAVVPISLEKSSAASQAVGPVLSDLEMHFAGRRFPDVGRKLLRATVVPLGQQLVAPTDSVLSSISLAPSNGINARYAQMVQAAFYEQWWDAPGWVVDLSGGKPELKAQAAPSGPNQFSVMEYNFSLFFGLAVQEYEKTLISDDTPFDHFMEGEDSALSDVERHGLEIFLGKGKCINCHGGRELTNASISNVQGNEIIERMVMGDNRVAVYDNGFYNIGVRPTLEDLGVGARIGPRNMPLSNSRLFQEKLQKLVKELQAAYPQLSLDEIIRLANKRAGIPRILARPAEAEPLLHAVVPNATTALTSARDQLAAAIASLPAGELKDLAAAQLAIIDGLLAQAATAYGSGSANGAAPKLAEVASKEDALATQLAISVTVFTDVARDLLGPGLSLLPDPIDPGPDPSHPYAPPLRPNERVAVDGAFKVPGLRNLSETAPFFHNGGQATLEQVVDFYNRGGDFAHTNRADLDPDIQRLGLTEEEKHALVAFLRHGLTDPRVHYERAPFDHPSISVPNGGETPTMFYFSPTVQTPVWEERLTVPAVGAAGNGTGLGVAGTVHGHFLEPLK